MVQTDLARFLTESASDLLNDTSGSDSERQARHAEAAELLNLGVRILNRTQVMETTVIQEAA